MGILYIQVVSRLNLLPYNIAKSRPVQLKQLTLPPETCTVGTMHYKCIALCASRLTLTHPLSWYLKVFAYLNANSGVSFDHGV